MLLTVLTVLVIFSAFTYYKCYQASIAEKYVRYVGMMNVAAEKIGKSVRGMEMNAMNEFDEVEKHLDSPESVIAALESKTNLNPEVRGYFAAFEPNGEGGFTVRDGHAHAFVEVYIPGAGWLTFDPTVSDYRTLPEDDDSNFDMAVFLRILSRFIVVIIVGFVIIFIVLLDRIVEAIFRIRLRFADPTKRTLMLYANVIRLVNFSTKEDYSSYTVKMLRKYLELTRATVPDVLFDLFERTAFGGYTPSQAEFHEAYRDYKRCYKYLRRLPRPKELARLKGIPYVKAK